MNSSRVSAHDLSAAIDQVSPSSSASSRKIPSIDSNARCQVVTATKTPCSLSIISFLYKKIFYAYLARYFRFDDGNLNS